MSKYQALIDAPRLHDQIMNIQCDRSTLDWANTREAYQYGHRDARHAAAKLANAQEAVIRSLLADLERAEKALSELLACGGVIADAEDHELRAAIQDQGAEQIVKVQAVAVLNARAAISQLKGVQ